MATALDYLTAAYQQACQRLSELDAVPVSQRIDATYTAPNGETFDYNGYRAALLNQIKELKPLIQSESGPIEVWA